MTEFENLTYAICTRDRADSLDRALRSILGCGAVEAGCKVVVLDNGSSDQTANLLKSYEPRGVRPLYSREPSIIKSRWLLLDSIDSDLICFVDDDNELQAGHHEAVFRVMETRPSLAGVGGFNEGVFTEPAPKWSIPFMHLLAVGAQSRSGEMDDDAMALWTSGMVVRRAACLDLRNRGFVHVMQNRGGDTELSYALRLAGWHLGYSPELRMKHHIASTRLEVGRFQTFFADLHRRGGALEVYKFALQGLESQALVRRRLMFSALRSCTIGLRLHGAARLKPREPDAKILIHLYAIANFAWGTGLVGAARSIGKTWPMLLAIRGSQELGQ